MLECLGEFEEPRHKVSKMRTDWHMVELCSMSWHVVVQVCSFDGRTDIGEWDGQAIGHNGQVVRRCDLAIAASPSHRRKFGSRTSDVRHGK